MMTIFRIFFGAKRTRPGLVLFCLVLAGVFEIVSIGALLPLMGQLGGTPSANPSELDLLIKQVFEMFGLANNFETIVFVIVGAMVIKGVMAFGALGYVSYAIADVVSAMRSQLVRQLLDARWSYYTDQRVGRIANALSNDATRAGTAYQRAARFVAYFVQAIVYVSAAILISHELALMAAVVGIVLLLATSWLVKISRDAGFRQTDSTSDLTTLVADTMNNIRPLNTMERKRPSWPCLRTA